MFAGPVIGNTKHKTKEIQSSKQMKYEIKTMFAGPFMCGNQLSGVVSWGYG